MQIWLPRRYANLGLAAILAVGGCSPDTPAADPAAPLQSSSSAAAPAGLVEVDVRVPDGLGAAPFDRPRRALIPAGWTMSVWARAPKPRLEAWAPDGALLVSQPSTGRVLRLPASGGTQPETALDGLSAPHGLAFVNSTLYVAESNRVRAYAYAGATVSNPRVVADGLPDDRSPDLGGAYAHALKSVAIGPDGAVYFSIGSTGNVSPNDRTANPPRATIMRVPPGGGPAAPFATGVRNGTGLAVAPDGSVWTAVNNRDNVAEPSTGQVLPDYVDDHPPESIVKLTPGRELGWPYCNPDGGPANLALIRDVQTNANGARLDCAPLTPIEQSMGAHSAPLGLSLVDGTLPAPYDHGALIGVHGSWNRQHPRAPEVSFYPWRDGGLANQQTLVGGFQTDRGQRWGRPVAAVVGPDGAVYVSDDDANAIYRVAPPGH